MRGAAVSICVTAVAATTVLCCAGVSASGPLGERKTEGSIEAFAMDGPLVAYAVGDEQTGCHPVSVWNVRIGSSVVVSRPQTGRCGDNEAAGQDVVDIALAGEHVAWIRNISGNTESVDRLYTSSAVRPRERRLASVVRRGDVDGAMAGGWLGGLAGDDSVLVVNRWRTDASGSVVAGSLDAIRPRSLASVADGVGTLLVSSSDRGRVAVLRRDGTVALYSASGTVVRTLAVPAAREVALGGRRLVVLARRTIEVYDAGNGELVHSWQVPAGAGHLDVKWGIAVYSAGHRLYALRLATGDQAVLATARRVVVGAQIEAAGAVYGFNTVRSGASVGNLVFLPMRRVLEALS
jgi:hypothetical protein